MPIRRGLVLSPAGLQRLEDGRKAWERDRGRRCTQEELCELSGLSRTTISRILRGAEAVDKESIERIFSALELESLPRDFCTPLSTVNIDWGEAVDCSCFVGRERELQLLTTWILQDQCRLVSILGIGGIGKTSLSIKTVESLKESFDLVIWRSLKSLPAINSFLSDILSKITGKQSPKSDIDPMILVDALRDKRVLLILDNVDSLLETNGSPGIFSTEFRRYRDLFVNLASIPHVSSIILTSRERLEDLTVYEGENLPVRIFPVEPLRVAEIKDILAQKGIESPEQEIEPLVLKYGGNPLCIKLVANVIHEIYSGDIKLFLKQSNGLFNSVKNVLENQFRRLTPLERSLMFWLAIYQEPISIETLEGGFVPRLSTPSLLDILQSLTKRSLIERNSGPRYSQQAIVSEFVLNTMIDQWHLELSGYIDINILRTHPISYANVPVHVQSSHRRILLRELSDSLLDLGKNRILMRLQEILRSEQQGGWEGYVASNVITLAVEFGIPLSSLALSGHFFRGLSFQSIDLKDVDMGHSRFHQCVFAQPYAEVMNVQWHPTEPLLAVAGGEGDVLLWSMIDESLQIVTRPHGSHVWCVGFSVSGTMMVTTSNDKSARIWSHPFKQYFLSLPHDHKVYWAEFSPDEKTVVTTCSDGKIRVWDVETGAILSIIDDTSSESHCLAFSKDGDFLISGDYEGKILVRDFRDGSEVLNIQAHHDGIRSVDVSANNVIATGSFDNTVKLWDLSGVNHMVLSGHNSSVLGVRFSPDGRLLATASMDNYVGLWNVQSGSCRWLKGHQDWVRTLCFSPDGRYLVSGGDDRSLRVWDVDTGKCQSILKGYTNGILSLKASGRMVASGSADKRVRLWLISDQDRLSFKTELGRSQTEGSALAIDRTGQIIATNTQTGIIQVWDHKEERIVSNLIGHSHTVTALSFDGDSRLLVSGDCRGWVCLWDFQMGVCLWVSHLHDAWVWDLVFHPSQALICSGSDDGNIRIWDYSGDCCQILSDHGQPVTCLRFTPDQHLVSCSFDLTVRIWDRATGRSTVLRGARDVLWTVAVSSDGRIFAAGTDRHIHYWIDGDHYSWLAHSRAIYRLEVSGDRLISASSDETIKVWDWRTGQLLSTTQMPRIYENLNLQDTEGLSLSDLTNLQRLGATI